MKISMMLLATIGLGYLAIGAIALVIFESATGRIRARLRPASTEMQSRLATTGHFVGYRVAPALLLAAIWLFWPAAFIGAVTKDKGAGDKDTGNKKEDEIKNG